MPERIPFPDRIVGGADIVRGVVGLVVDEAKMLAHSVFRMPRSQGYRSDHVHEPEDTLAAPIYPVIDDRPPHL